MSDNSAANNEAAEPGLDAGTKRLLIALVFGGIAPILDTTIVAIGLHTLVTRLHSTVATIQWISTGYLLALAIAIPFVGWAHARFGGKRLWLFSLALFLLGSVLCACSWNAESLIVSRIFQGLGGGILFPLLQTLAMENARERGAGKSMGKAMAIVSLPMAVGPILGPILGGLVLNWLDWQWLFLINVPICIIAFALAFFFVPNDRPAANTSRARLDFVGALLLAPALAGLLYSLSNVHAVGGFGRSDVLLPLLAGAVLLVAFVAWALKRDAGALVDVRLLGIRSVRSSSIALVFLGGSMFGGMFLLPLYWQSLHGYDVLGAAILLIPQGVGSLFARTMAGTLTDRFGSRWVAVGGFLVVAASTVPFAFAGPDSSPVLLGATLFVRGLGLGAVLIPVMIASYIDLAPAAIPHAAMITRIVQQLGGSFGTALVAVILQAGLSARKLAEAFDAAFWWVIGITIVAAICSLMLPVKKTEASVAPET
jgi:EmrB/QacA subfamily drug resistance transporter